MFKGFLSEGGIRKPDDRGGQGRGRQRPYLGRAGPYHGRSGDNSRRRRGGPSRDIRRQPVAPSGQVASSRCWREQRARPCGPADWIGWEMFGNRAVRRATGSCSHSASRSARGEWQLYNLTRTPARQGISRRINRRYRAIDWALGRIRSRQQRHLPDISPLCDGIGVTHDDAETNFAHWEWPFAAHPRDVRR